MRETWEDTYEQQEDIIIEKDPNVVPEVSADNPNQSEEVQHDLEDQEQTEADEKIESLVSQLHEETKPVEADLIDSSEEEGTIILGKLVKTKKNLTHKIEEREIDIDWTKFVYRIYIRKRDWVVDNCKVMDSYKIDDPETIKKFIDEIFDKYPDLLSRRDKESYCREWLAHNFLYKLHILRIATRDVDMDIYSIKLLQKAYRQMWKWDLLMQKRKKNKK